MSPEQAKGLTDQIDIRADLYALGATLFHLLTGQPLFSGPTPAVIMAKHLTETPPLAHRVAPQVSEPCSRLIARLVQKQPNQRIQSPAELVEQLDRLLAPNATSGTRHPSARGSESRLPAQRGGTSARLAPIRGLTPESRAPSNQQSPAQWAPAKRYALGGAGLAVLAALALWLRDGPQPEAPEAPARLAKPAPFAPAPPAPTQAPLKSSVPVSEPEVLTLQEGAPVAGGGAAYQGCRTTYLFAFHPEVSNGSSQKVNCGSSSVNEKAGLCAFDLAPLDARFQPGGAEVLEAKLSLFKSSSYTPYLELCRIQVPWNAAEATWNSASKGVKWRVSGGDVAAKPSATLDLTKDANNCWKPCWCEFDVTASLREALQEGRNYGWRIQAFLTPGHEPHHNLIQFASARHPDPALRPKLVLKVRAALSKEIPLAQAPVPEDLDLPPQALVWTGGAGTQRWSSPSSWAGGVLPTPTSCVAFTGKSAGTCLVDTDASVAGLYLSRRFTGKVQLAPEKVILVSAAGVRICGGALDASGGKLETDGGFFMTGGEFLAPAGVLRACKELSISGGTFRAGSGTLLLSPLVTAIKAAKANFHHVTIETGGNIEITEPLHISGNLRIKNANTFHRGMNSIEAGEPLFVEGDVYTEKQFPYSCPRLTLCLVGKRNQRVVASNGSGYLPGVRIRKEAGQVTCEGTLYVSGDWLLESGKVETAASTIVLCTGNLRVSAGAMEFKNLGFNTLGNVLVEGTVKVSGNLTIEAVNDLSGGKIEVRGEIKKPAAGIKGTTKIVRIGEPAGGP